MKAVVLVGGEGTRLRPLTYTTPKQMLPVAGKPVIERVVEYLRGHGVDEVVLSLGYRPDAFTVAYPEGRCAGVELVYVVEPSPLDTAGAIAFAAAEAGITDETFAVVNGDVLTEIDLSELVELHRSAGAEATIALTPVRDPSSFGVVPVDGTGRVTAFIEKPAPGTAPTNMINAGVYVLEPSFLQRVEPGRRVSVEREVFPALVAAGSLYALGSDALWTDMGTPQNYLEANLVWAEREGWAQASDGARVADNAKVSSSVLHAGVVVDSGATVEGSVLLTGARVRSGAVVRRSVLGTGVDVREDALVDDLSVIGDGFVVEAGSVLVGARLPAP